MISGREEKIREKFTIPVAGQKTKVKTTMSKKQSTVECKKGCEKRNL